MTCATIPTRTQIIQTTANMLLDYQKKTRCGFNEKRNTEKPIIKV